jgi:hypothetical protein
MLSIASVLRIEVRRLAQTDCRSATPFTPKGGASSPIAVAAAARLYEEGPAVK